MIIKFKFFYEMFINLILFLFLIFILYYFDLFFLFLKKFDLNDMVFGGELWELGDELLICCVLGWNGYLWNIIILFN